MRPIGIGSWTPGAVELGQRVLDVERARAVEDRHDPEREPDVADAVDDERLLGGEGRRALRVPEADQRVARQPDQLPAGEHEQPRVREHQQEHREHEQVEVGEEPPRAVVVGHVPDRVDVHEHADRGHDDQEAGRQRVDVEADVDVEAAGRDPVPELDVQAFLTERRSVLEGGRDDREGDQPDGDDADDRHDLRRPPAEAQLEPTAEQRVEREAGDRDQEEQRDQRRVDAGVCRSPGIDGRERRDGQEVDHRYCRIASYSSTSGVFLLR